MVYNVPYRESVRLDVGKVIIDTDAGPDDAAAIFMALNGQKYNSELKVIAITCVNGNTIVDNVVVNVLKTLKTANRLDVSYRYIFINVHFSFHGWKYLDAEAGGDSICSPEIFDNIKISNNDNTN